MLRRKIAPCLDQQRRRNAKETLGLLLTKQSLRKQELCCLRLPQCIIQRIQKTVLQIVLQQERQVKLPGRTWVAVQTQHLQVQYEISTDISYVESPASEPFDSTCSS